MRKDGRVAFFGRYPRFKPELFPQDVTFWSCGDKPAAQTFGVAQIKEIEWTLDQKNLINASLAFPFGIAQTDLAGQLASAAISIASYGVRTLSLPDLIEGGQPASTFQPALSANDVALAYAQYYVDNYAAPQLRISKLVFEVALGSTSASAATWAFVLGVEIGHILTVYTNNPGGGGFSKGGVASETVFVTGSPVEGDILTATIVSSASALSQFFVEGIHYTAGFQDDTPVLTLSLDVSPRGWFDFAPWET